MVLLRALHKDIARYLLIKQLIRYNQIDMQEDVQEDSGWKLVHGDVFRPPRHTLLLSVLLGSGSQLFMMVGATTSTSQCKTNTVFALLGFLSPSNRGALTTVMIILYVLFGFISGFVSSYTYKNLGGENWKFNIALTPILIPGYLRTPW
jgi:transmembrane 9 superfamily member 2/4